MKTNPHPELRMMRKKERIGLFDLAHEMGISAQHLHGLEHGRRKWTAELVTNYTEALNRMSHAD